MTNRDEGDEEGVTYDCVTCGDSGWIADCRVCPAPHCCTCKAGKLLAGEIAAQAIADPLGWLHQRQSRVAVRVD